MFDTTSHVSFRSVRHNRWLWNQHWIQLVILQTMDFWNECNWSLIWFVFLFTVCKQGCSNRPLIANSLLCNVFIWSHFTPGYCVINNWTGDLDSVIQDNFWCYRVRIYGLGEFTNVSSSKMVITVVRLEMFTWCTGAGANPQAPVLVVVFTSILSPRFNLKDGLGAIQRCSGHYPLITTFSSHTFTFDNWYHDSS